MTFSRVFITGASAGIGAGLALHYGRQGTVLGLVARREELLRELAGRLESQGARVHVYAGDVGDTEWMARTARSFIDSAGGADLVVANAGIGIPDVTRRGDSGEVARLLRINLTGVTNTVMPFVPSMAAQKSGVLSAVSSMLGHRAVKGRAAYCASKAGIIAFMDALRMDLHGSGVHAMTLCPGYVKTPMTARYKNMIFAIEIDEAVALMTRAIERRRSTYTFPWQMRALVPVMKLAPEWLLRRLGPPPRE